jgi:hypothetical protein
MWAWPYAQWRFDIGHERGPLQVAKLHQFSYAFRWPELRSVGSTITRIDTSVVQAADAISVGSRGGELIRLERLH